MRTDLKELIIDRNWSIKAALKRMSDGGEKILIVVSSNGGLQGILTDGDIRRWIINCGGLEGTVKDCYNPLPILLKHPFLLEDARALMLEKQIEYIPIVKKGNQLIGLLKWDDVFKGEEKTELARAINYPVVIMAGGKGTRLDPFTRILPKPLIPINETPVIELIIERFLKHRINDFFITVNHKSRILKAYFEEIVTDYNFEFIEENKPLGTAGSLRLIKQFTSGSLIVTNCDVIIKCDYSNIVKYHEEKNADITIVGAMRHFTVPYGVCEIANGGRLVQITEKPEYDFLVNTGMYIIKSSALELIPADCMFHFTDLIEAVQKKSGKVSVFPIEASSWIDVGQWEEYRKAQKILSDNY